MKNYSIMPLDADHIDEICLDIERQIRTGACTCPLFEMTLVPVGTPPKPTAKVLSGIYRRFKEKLDAKGIPSGILVQATIGHGWELPEIFPFTRYRNLTDGNETYTVCPSDESFKSFLRDEFRTLAGTHPSCIMVDDDFRLMHRAGHGCACDNHLAMMKERTGRKWTREELLEAVTAGGRLAPVTEAYISTQLEPLFACAKAMRAGIDDVDKTIPGIFCACGNSVEGASEIAKILAGEGNPVVIRLNNAFYCREGAKKLSSSFYRGAIQRYYLKDAADYVLAETDTCPQNRYSTSAATLHSHFTGSILEGCSGAKHWITRLAAFEPASGVAYRNKLSRYAGFYQALCDVFPHLSFVGCRIPFSPTPYYGFYENRLAYDNESSGFSSCVLERLGLPLYFSPEAGGVAFLDGTAAQTLSDGQLKEIFTAPFAVSGDGAMILQERGFGSYLGVSVHPVPSPSISGESFPKYGTFCSKPVRPHCLTPRSADVRVDSWLFVSPDDVDRKIVSPGVTVYKNNVGGTAVVFAGDPNTEFELTQAFSFLNESRKRQIADLLTEFGALPVFCLGDEEVYMKAALTDSGELFAALFNLGFDEIETVRLRVAKPVSSVEILKDDGKRVAVDFTYSDGVLTVAAAAKTLTPLILFIK